MSPSDAAHSTGVVLGKFMPPHRGHEYLIDFARNYVRELTVLVGSLESEPIPGALRHRWVSELFPQVNVVHLTDENPQYPHEHPDFWEIWRKSILGALTKKPECLFASEEYGEKLAETIGARFVAANGMRSLFPVSGTDVRKDPMGNWSYLSSCVRPYFVRRVCVFGPESTGKSTLSRQLAERYESIAVPEYARQVLEPKGGRIEPDDFHLMARGQIASEDALARHANRVLFCDTDVLTTAIWSDVLFGKCPRWILDEANRRSYDLHLLTDIDVPWVEDPIRYLPDDRRSFMDRCVRELKSRSRRYVKLSGSWDERFRLACQAVDELLARPGSD